MFVRQYIGANRVLGLRLKIYKTSKPINRIITERNYTIPNTKMSKHGDFNKIQSERVPFSETDWVTTQIPNKDWIPGTGAHNDEWKSHKKVAIDPYAEGRPSGFNYKTLISAITPRPIGFVSSVGKDGQANLAPFSYFSLACHDPPTFTLGISYGNGYKDTAQNILDTNELTINIISEWFVEAANYTSINAPYGVDEWELSGLTKAPSIKVKPAHVAESAFSIEGKLVSKYDTFSKTDPDKQTGSVLIIEGVYFHAREDVINEDLNQLDIGKLKPVSRLGGITYGRTTSGFEAERPVYATPYSDPEVAK
ncbi:hypothetical protein CAAN1_12S00914 [[Candida] anglica]|uniref:Flavin reductase like domain-containing protein n=1 Tax=[Candida] anglica TaxID=148631 RepID=A0ABP0E791_9ASCO